MAQNNLGWKAIQKYYKKASTQIDNRNKLYGKGKAHDRKGPKTSRKKNHKLAELLGPAHVKHPIGPGWILLVTFSIGRNLATLDFHVGSDVAWADSQWPKQKVMGSTAFCFGRKCLRPYPEEGR